MTMKTARTSLIAKLGKPTWTETNPATDLIQAEQLWKGVEEDTGHPLLMDFLAKLIEVGNVPARDPEKLARAVQLYSARKVKFFRERPERFQSAMRTIAWGIGDCDDKSRFIAASLRSFRIPVHLKFMRFDMATPSGASKKIGHVYPEAHIDGKWIPLESVREYPWGYDPMDKPRAKGKKVEVQIVGDKPE